MGVSTVPERFAATGTDTAVSITRAVTMHRIGVRLVFDERLDAERLERAVRLTLDAEPILGCSFCTDEFKAYWERIGDLDSVRAFTVLETQDPERANVEFQTVELGDSGPHAAVGLFRSADRDILGIKVNHVAADGSAAKQYAYLLASIYTRLGVDPAFTPTPNVGARPTARDVWAQLDSGQQRAAKKAKSWALPNWDVPATGQSGEGLTYRSEILVPGRFAELKAQGTARGATVNDLLLTAFFRACVLAFQPAAGKPLSLMCTADLRRYLPDAARLPIGNISISGSLDIARVEGESFDDTLVRMRERMGAWGSACYGAAPALNAEKMTSLGYTMTKLMLETMFRLSGGSGKTYPWFTNIGILDDARLRFGDQTPVAGSMYGPATRGASIIPAFSTYRNEITMCMGFCPGDMDAGVVDRVLSLTKAELESLLSQAEGSAQEDA